MADSGGTMEQLGFTKEWSQNRGNWANLQQTITSSADIVETGRWHGQDVTYYTKNINGVDVTVVEKADPKAEVRYITTLFNKKKSAP
jgi:hypothetical protein